MFLKRGGRISAATALLGTALWAVLYLAAGAGQEVLSGVPVVLAIQVIVAMAGSLVGVVYARYKWVGVAMIALLAGGTAGVLSFLMVSTIRSEGRSVGEEWTSRW